MKGLSLIEMLIAISLFALLALLGSSLLNISVSSNLSIQEKNDRLDKLVLLNKYLRQDFTQSVNTIPRDQMGAYELSTMELNSSDSDEILLRLIKLSDTDGLEDTGALRKIIYKLDNGELIRESYRYIDNEDPFHSEILLDEVDYVDLEIIFEYEWIKFNRERLEGEFVSLPEREQIPENINEQLIVELYSK